MELTTFITLRLIVQCFESCLRILTTLFGLLFIYSPAVVYIEQIRSTLCIFYFIKGPVK